MVQSSTKIRFYNFGSFCLDTLNCELLMNGEHVALTQKSFEILHFLIKNRGKILKKEEILTAVWTENFVEEANLAQHVYMIRKVLKSKGDEANYIETVPKYGYRFVGKVKEDYEESQVIDVSLNSNNNAKPKLTESQKDNATETKEINEKSEESIPPADKAKLSLLFPNIAFATILFAIISVFIYLTYFNNTSKKTDISDIKSISILPFKQIGGNEDEKLELGLADTLISRLGNQDRISILPTSTIEKITDTNELNSFEIGEKLEVDAILTGTIQKEGEFVRVNVQLIDVKSKVPLWTNKFDTEFSNVFSLQDKISDNLANKLSIKLEKPSQFETKDNNIFTVKAKEELEKGIALWNERTEDSLNQAIKHFTNAISINGNFAEAYGYLADTYSLVSYYKLTHILPQKLAIEKAENNARKALELNSNQSEAYMALAMVAVSRQNNSEARKHYETAIRLKPNNATAHLRLAWTLTTEESLDEAIKEMRLAQKARPQSYMINASLARLLRLNRQTDEALSFIKKAVKLDPNKNLTRMMLAEVYEQKGQLDKSIEELESVPQNTPEEKTAKLLLSRVYAKKGKKKEARKMLRKAHKMKSKTSMPTYEVATIYTHLGEKKEAVKKLQKAKEDSLIYFLHLKYDYNIDPLRNTPEYTKLLSLSKNKIGKNKDKDS